MHRNHRSGLVISASVLLGLSLISYAPSIHGAQRGKEKSPLSVGELVQLANKKTLFALDRIDAIKALGKQSDPKTVQDQRVVEALLRISQSQAEDMFVRIEAIQSLGFLQGRLFKTNDYAKAKYLQPFTKIMKDRKEYPFIRAAICRIFARTLELKGLRDEQAFKAMLDIMDDPNVGHPTLAHPLTVRIEAANAIGTFGSPEAFKRLSSVLLDRRTDPLLKEKAVRALYNVLGQVEDIKDQIKLPTINKLIEMVRNPKVSMEIRAEVMKALARLHRHGVKAVGEAMVVIRKIIEKEDKMELVVAAVEALGIAGDSEALPVLKDAFSDFYGADPLAPKDVPIRAAIMQTMGYLLSAQTERKPGPDEVAIKKITELLLKATDPDPQAVNTEYPKGVPNEKVVAPALFALRYLYPNNEAFKRHHSKVSHRLLDLLKRKKSTKSKKSPDLVTGPLRDLVVEALYFITQQPFGDNPDRWDRWLDKKYPGFKIAPKKKK